MARLIENVYISNAKFGEDLEINSMGIKAGVHLAFRLEHAAF